MPKKPISKPWPTNSAQICPVEHRARPAATLSVPPSTQVRMPPRSANHPIAIPPNPVPTQVSAPASASTERGTPSSSSMARSPTTISNVEP